jgi:hypothetical protein
MKEIKKLSLFLGPILFGDRKSPDMRINALCTEPSANDEAAGLALDTLLRASKRTMMDLVFGRSRTCFRTVSPWNRLLLFGQTRRDNRGSDRWLNYGRVFTILS